MKFTSDVQTVIHSVLLTLAFTLTSSLAIGGEAETWSTEGSYPINILWIDSKGNLLNLPFKTSNIWAWKTDHGIERPYLRVTIDLPKDYEVKVTKEDRSEVIQDGKNQVLLGLKEFTNSISVEIKDEKNQTQEVELVTRADASVPVHLIHPFCRENSIAVKTLKGAEEYSLNFVYCRKSDKQPEVLFFSSEGYQLARLPAATPLEGDVKLGIAIPMAPPTPTPPPLEVSALKDQEPKAQYSFYYDDGNSSEAPSKRYSISPAVSGTTLYYREPSAGADVHEIALQLGVSGHYTLLKDKFDAEASFYGLIPMTSTVVNTSTSSTASASFIGGQADVRYRLPIRMKKVTWYVSAGAFFWKMLVSDQSYGILTTNGPTFGIQSRLDLIALHPIDLWFRYSALADTSLLSGFSNPCYAFGASYRITHRSSRNFFATADGSITQFSSASRGLQMSLQMLSVGVRMEF